MLIAEGTVMYIKFSSLDKNKHKHPKNHLQFWQVNFENALNFLMHITTTLGSLCKLEDSTSVTFRFSLWVSIAFLKYETPLEAAPTNYNYHLYHSSYLKSSFHEISQLLLINWNIIL